ncbi:MAG: hypothetical protein HQ534_12390 [Armatimonadetes bacterium]|nr:hypothetical protein [Armatimonadota bacterium]
MKRVIFTIFFLMVSILLLTNCAKVKEVEVESPEPIITEEPVETEKSEITSQTEIEEITEEPEVVVTNEIEVVTQESKEEIQPEITIKEELYELQVLADTDSSYIHVQKNKLAQAGYNTKITIFHKDEETFYRLRLEELYTHPEAIELGEKLKEQFSSIREYWIHKVK